MNTAAATRTIRTPGPDHPITIVPHPGRVVVTAGDRVIADSRHARVLEEASYPAVFYIPRADATMDALARTQTETYCPYKGDCHYFSIDGAGEHAVDAVWTYEQPYPAVAAIKDHLAFYPNRVDSIVGSD